MNHVRDRRRSRRHNSIQQHGIVSARVKPARDVSIINACAGGVLIDGLHRLLPNSRIEVQFSALAERSASLRGRVLRCAVSRLEASAIWYQAAIRFDHLLPWLYEEDRGWDPVLGDEMELVDSPRSAIIVVPSMTEALAT